VRSAPIDAARDDNEHVFSRFGGLRSPAIHFGSTNKKRYPPYFPLGAGHNDVVESNPHAYYTVVDNFVRKVTSRNQEGGGGGGGSAAISRTSVEGAVGAISRSGADWSDCSSDFAAPVGGRLGPSQMQMGTQEQFEPFTSKIGLSVTVGPDDNRYADIRNKNALAGMQKL